MDSLEIIKETGKVGNKYKFTIIASKRARNLTLGSKKIIENVKTKKIVTHAIIEVGKGVVEFSEAKPKE